MSDRTKTNRGFEYYLTDEQLRRYKAMPLEKRLQWLYQGNVLRMHYPRRIIRIQDRFRN